MITLALNVIVGPGESNELDACLRSVTSVPGLLDEIVIATTSHDAEVEKVARKYTDKVFYFKWVDDFGMARSFAQHKTASEYIFWMDADDFIPEKSRPVFQNLKQYIEQYNADRILLTYHLDFNEIGEPTQFGLRDKVYRRIKFRWEKAVHETLVQKNMKERLTRVNIKGCVIEHRQLKPSRYGLERNIKILERKYEQDKSDIHYAFYLARDLSLKGNYNKSIEIFDYIIKEKLGTRENLYIAANSIATHYLYEKDGKIRNDEINGVNSVELAETYARMAMSFSEEYAEPCILLGDIYHYRGLTGEAVTFYKSAMSRGGGETGFKSTPFYEEIPCERLSKIFAHDNTPASTEQALYYITVALKHAPNNEHYLSHRNKLKKIICEGRQEVRNAVR